jgi:hypothetical protein
MNMKQTVGKIQPDRLLRWRQIVTRQYAFEATHGVGYTRAEIEATFYDKWRMFQEVEEEFEIPPGVEYDISLITGHVVTKDD